MFKLEANGLTDVILGADGVYRIGRVTEIEPAQVDAAWDQKLAQAKVNPAAYRAAITSEVLRTGARGQDRRRRQRLRSREAGPGALHPRTRRRHRATARSRSATSSTRRRTIRRLRRPSRRRTPTWTVAQLKAQKAYDKIQADPEQFDVIARAESDETQAAGTTARAASCRTSTDDTQVDEAFRARSSRRASSPATCCRRSRAPSAGTWSR